MKLASQSQPKTNVVFKYVNNILIKQTHPNVMKYNGANHVIAMKNQDRTFPLNQDVNVLKWKLQSDDETHVPLQSSFIIKLKIMTVTI